MSPSVRARPFGAPTLGVVLVLASATLRAHDFWIEPATFTPRPGEPVALRLRVGEHLQGEALPYAAARVKRFSVHDAELARPVVSRQGAEPAATVRAANPGLTIVDYQSRASRVELDAATFDAYLRDEGLEAVLDARTKRPADRGPVRELFSRCAKSLLWVASNGTPDGTPDGSRARGPGGDRALGCTLELVAEQNPYLAPRDAPTLTFRLDYLGAPLGGALVMALNSADPGARQTARSDAAGRVSFRIQPGGTWLVKAVHMIGAPAGSDTDWQSYWASLTFGVTAAEP
jgi:uncharacterized GH25 family protein